MVQVYFVVKDVLLDKPLLSHLLISPYRENPIFSKNPSALEAVDKGHWASFESAASLYPNGKAERQREGLRLRKSSAGCANRL